LILGEWQVNDVLVNAERADLTISLLHHPWNYFPDWDGQVCMKELRKTSGVILRGHLHASELVQRVSQYGETLELAAGASFDGSQFRNSYQLIELNLIKGVAKVYLRVWNDSKRDWIADRNEADQTGPCPFL